ncbi:MAG: GLUG motif-containing protein [Balneola sp.]
MKNKQYSLFNPLCFLFLVLSFIFNVQVRAQSPDYAIDLDGSGNYLTIAHNSALRPANQITIELWVKTDDITTNQYADLWRKEETGRQLLAFQEYGTILSFGLNIGGVYSELDAPISESTFIGNWVHIAATYDGTYKRIYVNGTVIDSAAATGIMLTTGSEPVTMGSLLGTTEFFDGQIDEVRMWSAARTKAEINKWKDKRLRGEEANLELYLRFTEGSGLSIADISDNGLTANHADNTKTNVASWVAGKVPSFLSGSGTPGDRYQIYTLNELQAMNEFLDAHYVLMNDINASETSGWNSSAGFDPVGEGVTPFFSGTFEGQNFTIDSLYINRGFEDYVALFGYVTGTVASVRLKNMDITGRELVGGIAGFNDGIITRSSASGTISAASFSGGLAGWNDGSILESFTESSVSGTGFYAGGLAGFSDEGSISDSYSLSAVSLSGGSTDVGGLVGRTVVSNTITNSYSAGTVSGTTNGGLVGSVSGTLTITQSFWDTQATGQSGSAAGTGKTTMEMQNKSTFTGVGWNYSTIWYQRAGENNGYPQLQVHVADSGTAPSVSGVSFSGSLVAGDSLFVSYTFSDAEGDFDLSTYQWYRSDDASGTNKVAISGATNSFFISNSADVGKYLSVEVTPKDAFFTVTSVESTLLGPVTNPFTIGTGTDSDPYQITTLKQFQAIRYFLSHHFVLMNNIDASATSGWNGGSGFAPIGDLNAPFLGEFDGQGYSVSNLTIDRPSSNYTGVFGCIFFQAVIRNLSLNNVSITGAENVGGLVGCNNYGTISNSHSSGNVSGTGSYTGGLVGKNEGVTISISSISDSHSTVNVTGAGSYTGGLVGQNYRGGISNSYSTGSVSGITDVGGLIGQNYRGGISNSYSTGSVSGITDVGGLIGDDSEGSITRSNFTGSVSGATNVGGLVGTIYIGSISNSYSTGGVSGVTNVGGLVGQNLNGSISNSYVTGSVSGSANVESLIGLYINGPVTNCFWDVNTTGLPGSYGGTWKYTSEMKTISTFTAAGWDFNTIWGIDPNVNDGYPFLQEQKANTHLIPGDVGWRMMASPVSGASFSTLLDGLWTQGFTGASTTSGSPNIYFWDESAQSFTAPTSAGQIPAPGQGFIMYMFADDDNDGNPEGFPKSLSTSGSQHSGQLAPTLSFTDTDSMEADGWNLVGNPYGTTINWNAPNGWSKANLDATIYVWSDSASGGAGAYKSWNGTTGTLGSGKIAPWQGFWVKANATGPSMTVTDSVRNTGGQFLKKVPNPEIKLMLSTTSVPSAGGEQGVGHSGLHSTAIISFQQGASVDKDPLDAYKLQSLNGEYLLLGTSINGESVMDIQALPFDLEETELELDIRGSDLSGAFTLSWNLKVIPEDWQLILIDQETGEQLELDQRGELSFEISGKKQKDKELGIRNNSAENDSANIPNLSFPNSPIRVLQKSKAVPSRFSLRITTANSVSNEPGDGLPTTFNLDQNYPNPFNPSTIINYQLPEQSKVKLEVFDMLGRKVATLVDGQATAGYHQVTFNASNLASGMYIYHLEANQQLFTKKMLLIK